MVAPLLAQAFNTCLPCRRGTVQPPLKQPFGPESLNKSISACVLKGRGELQQKEDQCLISKSTSLEGPSLIEHSVQFHTHS